MHLKSVLPLVASLSLAGCPKQLGDFTVKRLLGVKVKAIDSTGFDMLVRCELHNPNPVDATISDVAFHTSTDGHLLGVGKLAGPVAVKAKSDFVLEVPIRVKYQDLPRDLPRRVAKGTLALTTDATFSAKTSLGTFKMSVRSHGTTEIAKTLAVAVRGSFKGDALRIKAVKLAGLRLRRVHLKLELTLKNAFPFPVRIKRARYTLSINGTRFGDGAIEQPISLPRWCSHHFRGRRDRQPRSGGASDPRDARLGTALQRGRENMDRADRGGERDPLRPGGRLVGLWQLGAQQSESSTPATVSTSCTPGECSSGRQIGSTPMARICWRSIGRWLLDSSSPWSLTSA